MPSLERFFDPQIRKFDLNVKPLPGARFYFFENGTTTPKTVYQDKAGTIPHTNPVIADASGSFPPIFLDGLYRVELRSNKNIVQPGWPIDNVGQDAAVVPFGPWVEILPYNEGEIVTGSNGNWYRSIGDNNLGNDPTTSPAEWEVIPTPVASSFTSNKAYLTWSDDGEQISLDADIDGLTDDVKSVISGPSSDLEVGGELSVGGEVVSTAAFQVYHEETLSLVGSGHFTAGSIKVSKIGSIVTVTAVSEYTHSSTGAPTTASEFLPADYRPPISVGSCSGSNTGSAYLSFILIGPAGQIVIRYKDFSGALSARTSGDRFSISYNV